MNVAIVRPEPASLSVAEPDELEAGGSLTDGQALPRTKALACNPGECLLLVATPCVVTGANNERK